MAHIAFPTMLIALTFALVTAAVLWAHRVGSKLPLPPGPRPLPFIGNLFDMPKRHLAPALRELGEKYGGWNIINTACLSLIPFLDAGELTYLNMLGQPMIILNSYEAAAGLLESRSANTSDRPGVVMAEL